MMHRFSEIRRTRISGRLANHMRKVGNDWIARINQTELNISLDPFANGCRVNVNNARELTITSTWTPGKTLAEFDIGGDQMQLRVKPISEGYHIEYRGAELDVLVRTGRQQELGSYMKEKELPDTSKYLLCPMPGLITEIHVSVGDKVEDGQPLCTVEAMKMENVLKASRKGAIKSIAVSPGSSLTVDQVILEFE
ncbi:MAG: acetyl/propionyl-CoA carboxylase subunit alpha, partial [Rhodobacteraceae bacterium]|nr:acetyl/propionyl-CoA carboxylase subunit alpha [Paracoccaceae bacterium]